MMIPPHVRHLLDHLLLKQRGKEMTEIEDRICQGIWQNHDYNTISKATGYQPVSVRRLASQLFQELSTATGQKVTKQNFQPSFNQLALDRQSTVDWEDAPTDIQPFCGRIEERSKLSQWISIDRCKLIAILGIGGVGKTALATKIGQQLQDNFDFVIWRSLREAPPLNQLLGDLIGVLSQHTNLEIAKTSPKRIAILLEQLQQHRCLIILDNVEAIMNPGEYAGNYREGYGNYGDLFHRLGSTQQQSCTLITSREPPPEIAELSSEKLPVRTLPLRGIDDAGTVLLEKMSVAGKISELQSINDRCQGNPLYLRIIANTIANNFDGDLAAFLESDRYTYAKISNILTAQLARLTIAEKLLIYCLAIRREPVSIETLAAHFAPLNLDRSLPTTIDSLIKRSIVQAIGSNEPISTKSPSKSRPNKRYTLQNVILEFTTDRLLAELQRELAIPDGLFFFNHLAIHPASSPAYIREIQQRLFRQPLARAISQQHQTQAVERVQSLIPLSRSLTPSGYAAGNTIELACELQADFTGWDLTNLYIAETDFQAMLLRRVDFRGTTFDRCRFAQGMGGLIGLSFSPDGQYLAASDTRFQIKIWEVATNREIAMLVGHQSWVWDVRFSHDSKYLISGSSDESIRIWEIASGECVQVLTGHRDWVWQVNFIFNSQLAVSIGADRQVKIWWWKKAQNLLTFNVPDFGVRDGVFHARRRLLAACGEDGIRIWQIWLGVQVKAIRDPQALNLRRLAFSPNGKKILGANFSRTIHCWDVDTGAHLFDLCGHPTQVGHINFENTGQIVSTCLEQIRVWNLQTGACLRTIDFAADCGKAAAYHAPFVATGSDNGTIQIWNLETGKCISTAGGCAPRMMSLATNSHNSIVASGKDDGTLSLWNLEDLADPITLQAHQKLAGGLAFSPNGKLVASTGSDRIIKVWDALTGEHLHSFEGHTDYVPQLIFADDRTIWSRGYDATTRHWDLETGKQEIFTALQPQWVLVLARSLDCQWIAFGTYTPMLALLHRPTGQLTSYPAVGNRLRQLTFTRDGRSIIGITDDRHLNRWQLDRDCLHTSANIGDRDAMAILCHPLYSQLLICGNDDGTISVWDLDRQIWIDRFQAHQKEINSISFLDRLNRAISCSVDGAIKVWELQDYSLVEVRSIESIKPYQLMQLGDNEGLNRAQITALVQLGASI
ncbi:NB-ARC domain-containing protein [Chamaesiphon minutus]|uniref:WD40 repeat-containing protein n=1 Tax=Chamaesiphon minutus (strain ATCC 27169 / PCC 6605) TaxID=1173020 RepID=K9UC95_CHAP6|nr:NB-ARC domain-containing protein [Chamaesiphon minutus]AFY92066.1 WD40 repeat-containing protein [Chamaesiphon minutus PCC 6605]